MYTSEALLDFHERCHQGLEKLISHCSGFSHEELCRSWDGFGYPTLQSQLCHVIGAEVYWFSVLDGRIDADDRAEENLDTTALAAFRAEVFATSSAQIAAFSTDDLNAPSKFETWGGKEMVLVPAQVIVRTQTHIFQHQGQMTAMCRLLDRPINGIDYSHEP